MARPRVAAGVLFTRTSGRQISILLVKPSYKKGWDLPGGYVEPRESPLEAAVREVSEEIVQRIEPGRLLVVDWAPHPDEGDKLLFVFQGGHLSKEPDISSSGELEMVAWWPASKVAELTPPRLARRIALAVGAEETGTTIYAEHGYRTAHAPADDPFTGDS